MNPNSYPQEFINTIDTYSDIAITAAQIGLKEYIKENISEIIKSNKPLEKFMQLSTNYFKFLIFSKQFKIENEEYLNSLTSESSKNKNTIFNLNYFNSCTSNFHIME